MGFSLCMYVCACVHVAANAGPSLVKVGSVAHPAGCPGEWRVLWASVQALSEPSELTEDEMFSKQPALQL